jgi:hypothetical protein
VLLAWCHTSFHAGVRTTASNYMYNDDDCRPGSDVTALVEMFTDFALIESGTCSVRFATFVERIN